ncbi:DUF6207 family protein [Streptomyces sp. NPDC019539]|uniref:DUF6207 family protein n=1 Tax=Streptomyces sp. NPDC019539 TaxID=3365063 RepID=UPI00378B272B
MKEIDAQHIAEPGLVVLDITAADEDTLRIVMDSLQRQWPPPASLRSGAPRASPASPPGSTPTSGDPAGSRDHCVHVRLRGEAGAVANWRQAPAARWTGPTRLQG